MHDRVEALQRCRIDVPDVADALLITGSLRAEVAPGVPVGVESDDLMAGSP